MEKTKILFVDDQSELIDVYGSLFTTRSSNFVGDSEGAESYWKSSQYEPLFARSGEEGLEYFKNSSYYDNPIRIAFLDMRMPPGMNGVQTAKRILEIDPKVEIVLITAYSDLRIDEINQELGRPEKFLYLKKPFYKDEIKQVILNLCEKSRFERIKDDFISMVSHELKTPLTSILGFSELILDDSRLRKDLRQYLRIVNENSKHMHNLIENLLYFSNNGESSGVKKNEKILDITQRVVTSLKPLLKEGQRICFKSEGIVSSDLVDCDETRYSQVVTNLVGNSIKYSNEGEIDIKLGKTVNGYRLDVKDCGIGIDLGTEQDIFEKFSRASNGSKYSGLGLGLSIVKEAVDWHEWGIEVKSTKDKGSCFSVFINQG